MTEANKGTMMNIRMTAKGRVQWEVTVEYDTPAESAVYLSEAIDSVRSMIKDKGLKEVSAAG